MAKHANTLSDSQKRKARRDSRDCIPAKYKTQKCYEGRLVWLYVCRVYLYKVVGAR
jgi:hypothetical protein